MSLNLRNGVRFTLVEICAFTAMAIYFEINLPLSRGHVKFCITIISTWNHENTTISIANTSNSFEIPMKYSLFCTQNQCHSWLARESRSSSANTLDSCSSQESRSSSANTLDSCSSQSPGLLELFQTEKLTQSCK